MVCPVVNVLRGPVAGRRRDPANAERNVHVVRDVMPLYRCRGRGTDGSCSSCPNGRPSLRVRRLQARGVSENHPPEVPADDGGEKYCSDVLFTRLMKLPRSLNEASVLPLIFQFVCRSAVGTAGRTFVRSGSPARAGVGAFGKDLPRLLVKRCLMKTSSTGWVLLSTASKNKPFGPGAMIVPGQ